MNFNKVLQCCSKYHSFPIVVVQNKKWDAKMLFSIRENQNCVKSFAKVVRILECSKVKTVKIKTHPKFTCNSKFFESILASKIVIDLAINNHIHLRTWEANKKRNAILPQSQKEKSAGNSS